MKTIIRILALITVNILAAQNFTFNFNTNGKRVCLLEAVVDVASLAVTIKLLDATANTTFSTDIYRRPLYGNGSEWILVAAGLPPGTTQWIDTTVSVGDAWEYQAQRSDTWTYSSQTYDATGYTVGAILKDNSSYQGRMILLVADNIVNGLPEKFNRLKKELTGEGWHVNEIVVAKAVGWDNGSTVTYIRNQVAAVYNSAPADDKPKSLFILGHVAMPRSGSTIVTAPDGHDQNKGARGCDGYYADIDGIYTDIATFNPDGLQTPLAINLPGDFKWDQDFFPSDLEMSFGRVDFEDLINFSNTEIQLTESYLDRLSNYRNVVGGWDMGDKSGFFFGYDNSNDGSFRSLPNLSKSVNVFQNSVGSPHPQWVQNNGPFKVYMQNTSFPEIAEWNTYGMDATVFSSDQSYWGFNDEPQSFYYSRIRALLALNTKCLITLWTTTGVNTFYQACTGEPIGSAVKEIMNHNASNQKIERPEQNYDTEDWWNRTHFSLNGDPTIRLYQVAPPSGIAIENVNNMATLSWTASPDFEVIGYHVYRSASEFGIFERITTNPITTSEYTDFDYQQSFWYMVRAIKIEESGCGKFLNPSIGIFIQGTFQLSITQRDKQKLSVFPNPANGQVFISGSYVIQFVTIAAADGRKIRKIDIGQNEAVIDLGGIASGVYFLEISDGKNSVSKKIIIE